MKAVRMYAPRDLRVEEVDIPSYEADECLIKVMAVGVCGSDIPRVNQYGAHVSPIIVLRLLWFKKRWCICTIYRSKGRKSSESR